MLQIGWLKPQKLTIAQLWGLEDWNQDAGRVGSVSGPSAWSPHVDTSVWNNSTSSFHVYISACRLFPMWISGALPPFIGTLVILK